MKAAQRQNVIHHDSNSAIALMESFDNGRQWDPQSFRRMKFPAIGVNDPALTRLRNSRILLRFTALEIYPSTKRHKLRGPLISHREEYGIVTGLLGNMLAYSDNAGVNWSSPNLIELEGLTHSCSRESIIELQDGTLLLSLYKGAPQRTDEAWCIRSFDQGKTWGDKALILSDNMGSKSQRQGVNYNETAILQIGNGKLLAIARADSSFYTSKNTFMPVGGIGQLVKTFSDDGGLSWYSPQETGLWGQPAHLLRLSNGLILCTYGYRKSPFGIRAAISDDGGEHWSKPVILRNDAISWDIGYPSSIELTPNKILTTYYFIDENDRRYIAGTIWKIT